MDKLLRSINEPQREISKSEKILLLNIDEIQFHIHSIEYFKRYCDEIMESDVDILQSYGAIKNRFAKVNMIPISIKPTQKISTTLRSLSIIPQRNYSGITRPLFKGSINIESFWPGNICIDRSGKIYVIDNQTCAINVYLPDITLYRIYGGTNFTRFKLEATAIAYYEPTDELIIFNALFNRIDIYTTEGIYVHSFNLYNAAQTKLTDIDLIAVDRKGRLIIASKYLCANVYAAIYNLNGNQIGEIKGDNEYTWLSSFRVLSDDRIVISENITGKLHVYNKDYSFSHSIGDDVLIQCSGIYVDSFDNILVPDPMQDKIFVFRPDGTIVANPDRCMIKNPINVIMDKHGKIYVITSKGNVYIFF